MKILVLGASGMLGYAIYRSFKKEGYQVYGTYNNNKAADEDFIKFSYNNANMLELIQSIKPDLIINCLGIIKQVSNSSNISELFKVNSILPKTLSMLAEDFNFKIIHFSTDCVFSGLKGAYSETSLPDPVDMYGMSKLLGEIKSDRVLNIRTSIIGHGLTTNSSLVDWFLSQDGIVNGYSKAIFSGLPVNEISKLMLDKLDVLLTLNGLFHLSASPIDKYQLLSLIKDVYGLERVVLNNSSDVEIDRSLNSDKFRNVLNYNPDDWFSLIKNMHDYYQNIKV